MLQAKVIAVLILKMIILHFKVCSELNKKGPFIRTAGWEMMDHFVWNDIPLH